MERTLKLFLTFFVKEKIQTQETGRPFVPVPFFVFLRGRFCKFFCFNRTSKISTVEDVMIASKASSRRARQLMGGVNGPNSRVHISQTLKQVVVQRCGFTSDRKAAPRPPAPAHPRQSQYMWTLKMHEPGIHLQERGRTCATQDARSFALMCVFVAALPPRAAP